MINGFSTEMSALIEAQAKKGRRIQIHQKSKAGTWKAEIWCFTSGWWQRGVAGGSDPLQALKFAIVDADKKWYEGEGRNEIQ